MKAVIQAGARRKRPMPISAKPVLELLLRWLRRCNVEAASITARDLGHLIRSFGSDGRRWGTMIHTQELEPLGVPVRCHSRATSSKARF
ncbi:MAG: hypothetical protein LCH80_14030 [Proteobacteria bacterium]|nr:hypothetical protein [Pseudomonadota bacterium]